MPVPYWDDQRILLAVLRAGSLLGGSKIVCDDKGCTTTLSQYVPFAKEPARPVKRYALEK